MAGRECSRAARALDPPPEHGPQPRASRARLRDGEVDAVNLHHSEWTGGLTTLFHRFGRFALGWDAQHVRVIAALLDRGIDRVFSDDVERLVESAACSTDLCGTRADCSHDATGPPWALVVAGTGTAGFHDAKSPPLAPGVTGTGTVRGCRGG